MAASIPAFNLRELNNALIKLLWNKDVSYDEIYCAPDFATGGILLNAEQVKESIKNGEGHSCKLRSKIEYNKKENCFIVTEIPYSVYTNTICAELEAILSSEENMFFDSFKDLTGKKPLIKIYLKKNANTNKAIKELYKNTSLQSYYGINFTMLKDGKKPKVFGWKEMLQSYLDHQINVYTRGFTFDLNKLKNRLHIVDGLLIALANIDEVVKIIKESTSTIQAKKELQSNFILTEIQAEAVLEIKLARLAHMEVEKLQKEKNKLILDISHIEEILNNEVLLKKEIEKDLIIVRDTFGDERRTEITNEEDEQSETIEIEKINIFLTNKNNILFSKTTNLYKQDQKELEESNKKFKLPNGEYILSSCIGLTSDNLLMFSTSGNCYNIPCSYIINNEIKKYIPQNETICSISTVNSEKNGNTVMMITKNGFVKKTLKYDFFSKKNCIKAITLEENDEVVSVLYNDDNDIGILTKNGYCLRTNFKNVRITGRITKGVKAIKLTENDFVIYSNYFDKKSKFIISISKDGFCTKIKSDEISLSDRYAKGTLIQLPKNDDDYLINFINMLDSDEEITIIAASSKIKLKEKDIPISSKRTKGHKPVAINNVIALLKI